jgi:hypothetical protein
MRRLWVLALVFVWFRPAAADAAAPAQSVTIDAQQIVLHADRGLLIAVGGVSIRAGSAAPLSATRAAYDLRANRLAAIGDGAGNGFVYDFAANKSGPDPRAAVPQLGQTDAFAIGQHVELRPGIAIAFSNAQVLAGSTFTPVASYVYAIPPPGSRDFGYSPVPSAALEWPLLLGRSADGYEFMRLRYDRYNGGPGIGLEEHVAASDRGYAALGQTLDADGARFDLSAYQRISGTLSQSLTATSLYGVRSARYALSQTGAHGFLSLSISQFDAARSDDLLASGNEHPFTRLLSLRFQADLGHDVHPGDWNAVQDFRFTPGVHADTAALRLWGASLTGSADLGESFYSYGRVTFVGDAAIWGNVPVSRRLSLSAGAAFVHDSPPFPSTLRTYTFSGTWHASDSFNLVSSLAYDRDFGQGFGVGRPQFSAAVDVRFRRRNHTGFEVGAVAPFGGVGSMYRQGVLNLRYFSW